MKVLHFAMSDYGGAGTAAVRLHLGMLAAGANSRLLVLRQSRKDVPGVTGVSAINRLAYNFFSRVSDRFVKLTSRRTMRAKYFYTDFNHGLLSLEQIEKWTFRPEFVIAHSISGFVPAGLLERISREWRIPAMWYFMDMGPLTGGCHFAFDCPAYMNSCGNCPAIESKSESDWSRRFWLRKKQAIEHSQIVAVAPNSWLERQARSSGLFRTKPIHKIELSVDLEKYAPPDRAAARRALGLPEAGPMIFFGAHFAEEERKGMRYLIEALTILRERHTGRAVASTPYLVTAGSSSAAQSFQFPFPHYHLGFLDDQSNLPLAYGAADVFVSPAIEDSGPMMVLESLSCGTPVVSFDMGVARDVIIDGQTGYVAELGNVEELATGISQVIDMAPDLYFRMRDNCRQIAVRRFAPQVQAAAFLDLMQSLGTPEGNLEES